MPSPTELRHQVLVMARDLHPENMTGEAAAAAVQELAVIEKVAATARMFAALRVAQTDAWRGQGHASAADWLAAAAGITVRDAAAQLGTARKADRLPKTKEQMRKGKLSPTQANAVADAATADPAAEDTLLDVAATGTTADLKAQAAKTKAAATDSATRERRIRAERSVRTCTDAEGAFCLFLRGPAADGVRIQAMLRPFEEYLFRHGRTNGTRDTYEIRAYDAFITMLAWYAASGTGAAHGQPPEARPRPEPEATPGGTTSSDEPPTPPDLDRGRAAPEPPVPLPDRLPGGNNTKVIVRIDHTALARGHTIAGETCDVAGLGPISVAAAKHLMQDAFLAAVITKGTDIVNVAHLGRGLNAHQRTALEAADLRCANRACNHTIAIQVDHRTPYAAEQVTALPNQDPLCPDCHRRKTQHGWHLEPGTGRRRFLPPDQRGANEPAPPASIRVEQPALC